MLAAVITAFVSQLSKIVYLAFNLKDIHMKNGNLCNNDYRRDTSHFYKQSKHAVKNVPYAYVLCSFSKTYCDFLN